MQLPSKVTSYEESILFKFLPILEIVKQQNMHVSELYYKVRTQYDSINEYLDALDCLYAINKIKLLENGMISYVI